MQDILVLTYDDNGGEGGPGSEAKEATDITELTSLKTAKFTIPEKEPTRKSYTLTG